MYSARARSRARANSSSSFFQRETAEELIPALAAAKESVWPSSRMAAQMAATTSGVRREGRPCGSRKSSAGGSRWAGKGKAGNLYMPPAKHRFSQRLPLKCFTFRSVFVVPKGEKFGGNSKG